MKSWTDDNPKASLMKRKRAAIVLAAREAFLGGGYAKTSMDSIATAAGVGIKTIYRHFENKDDLFSAVMEAACHPATFEELSGEASGGPDIYERPWFSKPPRAALVLAGIDYLRFMLSGEQQALYRVVIQDAHSFPELGRRYKEHVIDHSTEILVRYLEHWHVSEKWKIKDKVRAARTFTGLLRADVFDDALSGTYSPSDSEIASHVRTAVANILVLINAKAL